MRRKFRRIQPKMLATETPFFKPVQTKLKMGKAGDKYEVEADKMADKVIHKKGENNTVQKKEGEEEVQQKPLASEVTPFVQRMEGGDEESVQQKTEDELVQKMEEETVQEKEEEEVQTKTHNSSTKNQGLSLEPKLRRGNGGQQMETGIRSEMETGFGADFKHIKIHNDSEAAKMSSSIGAQAFTHGNDIYFNKGKYNPNSREGKHLLAHELTHTIQQKGMVQKKIQRKVDSAVPAGKEDKNPLAKYKTAFPYFYKYMNDHFGDYLTGSDKIKKALLKNTVGAFTPEKIKEVTDFEKGNGPKIELVEFSNPNQNGEYFYQGNTIKLNYKLIEKYEEVLSNPDATIQQKNAISISLNQVLINEFTHYGDALDGIDAIKDNQGNVINNPDLGEGLEGNFTSEYDEGNEAVAEIYMFYGTTMQEGLRNYAAHEKGVLLDPDTLREMEKDPSLIDKSLMPPIPKIK
ncbi:eCIS core domain-containing protein [Tenacibaculum amylolyticum]|uniref:eCIS core domain-containing protein n=1 Tax=Tenacibaculum amylolyticum TaxID=104269 RepID=UPI003895A6C3